MVLFHQDTSAILVEPIKTREANELLRAYKILVKYILQRGFKLDLHILDNEAPKLVKDFLQSQKIKFQLVPPYVHRANAAERAIRTFKITL